MALLVKQRERKKGERKGQDMNNSKYTRREFGPGSNPPQAGRKRVLKEKRHAFNIHIL